MLRPATPADRENVIALALAEDAAWADAPPVSADEAGELVDSFAPGVLFGENAGYAAAGDGGTLLLIDPATDPAPVLETLVAWLEERDQHEVIAYPADARRIAWLQAHGFAHRHSAFDLRRDIEPPPAAAVWPPGVAVRPFERGSDDEAIHRLVYVDAAWTEVPGHNARSLESWQGLNRTGWVAHRDQHPVGWISTRLFSDQRGWIEQLAVARSERGVGLGRALLLHALADLRAQGATSFALGVQAANANAIGLYRQAGFEVEREWRLYAR
jgi:GNAT superfamily N-acetyltransferase